VIANTFGPLPHAGNEPKSPRALNVSRTLTTAATPYGRSMQNRDEQQTPTRALPHGIAHESMAVQPLTLQARQRPIPVLTLLESVTTSPNRSLFRRGGAFPRSPTKISLGRQPIPPTAMRCRSRSAPPAQLLDHRNEFSSLRGSDSPRALSRDQKPNRPVEPPATRGGWLCADLFQPSNPVRFAAYHPQTSSNQSAVFHPRFRPES